MPTLSESLQGRDLGHLQIIANLWDIELTEQDPRRAIRQIATLMVNASVVDRMCNNLPDQAKVALNDLIQHNGRLAWAQFSRLYGEVREMGSARRDREQPYEQDPSITEMLWYRALIGRAFFDSPAGVDEFAFIPDDLIKVIPTPAGMDEPTIARLAAAQDYANICFASDRLLDQSCTLLAALRVGMSILDRYGFLGGEILTTKFLTALLDSADLLDKAGGPAPEPVRLFLEAKRGDALLQLYKAWKQSKAINELSLLPGLVVEGNWQNDPVGTRRVVLDLLQKLAGDTWWSLGSFISLIKQHNPDFQRPAGDYDSWFIRVESGDEYLRGFEHWDDVDGRLIRYILTGPLYWLGILELGSHEEGGEVTAFRLSTWSKALLIEAAPKRLPLEDEALVVRSDARVSARRLVPRRVRYQLARFCVWEKETPEEHIYRITPASLQKARKQGLSVNQLVSLLNHHAKVVPPSLIKALARWEQHGSEARLEEMVVLRVDSEEVIQALRKSRASRFLGETVGPTTIAIKPGAVDKVLGALAELGYLGENRVAGE
ncbi:MAG: hypothetical protein C3F13_04010 [Anaerolineales bacterium]|nr:hypothetical protein [Anaerolineae bacterium]PWB55840.1 MAG: hypothetical protein C3F13_04010 [Anaerolineales bacterium]